MNTYYTYFMYDYKNDKYVPIMLTHAYTQVQYIILCYGIELMQIDYIIIKFCKKKKFFFFFKLLL